MSEPETPEKPSTIPGGDDHFGKALMQSTSAMVTTITALLAAVAGLLGTLHHMGLIGKVKGIPTPAEHPAPAQVPTPSVAPAPALAAWTPAKGVAVEVSVHCDPKAKIPSQISKVFLEDKSTGQSFFGSFSWSTEEFANTSFAASNTGNTNIPPGRVYTLKAMLEKGGTISLGDVDLQDAKGPERLAKQITMKGAPSYDRQ